MDLVSGRQGLRIMHLCGPTKNFTWPKRNDVCWVAASNLLLKIDIPRTSTGRSYQISETEFVKITELFAKER